MNRHKYYKARRLRRILPCILSVLLIALLISLPGCAEEEPPTVTEPEIPAHFTTYTDEAGLFSISYPPDWEPALSIMADLEEAIKEYIESLESDIPTEGLSYVFIAGIPTETGWEPNVAIGIESISGIGLTLNDVVEGSVQVIKSVIEDYHEYSRVNTIIDGRKATILDWEGTYPDIGKVHNLQMYMLIDKYVWIVNCQPPTGEFSKWEDDFHAIVGSLRILK